MTHFLCVSEVRGEGGADVGNHRAVETEITITLDDAALRVHFLSSHWSIALSAAF